MTELFPQIATLANLSEAYIWAVFLVFLRVGAVMALMPAFGERIIPQRVRLGVGLAFTCIVTPAVASDVAYLQGTLLRPLLTEVSAGLTIGIGLRLFVMALQMAGTMAAQSTSLSQMFSTAGAEPQPAMSNLYTMAGLALAVMAGLHVRAAELLILSYDILPPGVLLPGPALAEWGVEQVARAFSLAFSLAAPFVAASVIYNMALGVINRAMPQLMVVFVGAPALTLGGLVLLAVSTPLILQVWFQAFSAFLDNPFMGRP